MSYAKAFNELKKMGAPVFKNEDGMFISAEENDDVCWADYYCEFNNGELDDFGVNKKINDTLDKYGLFAEWQNPGCVAICKL